MRNLYKFSFLIFISLGAFAQSLPTASIVSASALRCTGLPVNLAAASNQSTGLTYVWAILPAKGYSALSATNGTNLSITFTANLTYTILLSVSDGTNTATTNTIFAVSKTPKAAFNASLNTAGFPTELVLTNFSGNAITSSWLFSDQSTASNSTDLVRAYNAPGNYSVTLVAGGLNGCNDTSRYDFEIPKSSSIILPNVFTPNNDDVNEVYRPFVVGISTLKARIYNRYGIIVCSWDRVNGFWDGYTTSGEPCSAGEYFIVVEALGFDGQSYKLKSYLTLAR
ncbi:MAG: gliding motility-associated C-terminal domain-containing protein [Bacteroidia bacterium]|nr:gliding motility-associated C-terminal domain-containing protein [Bacteroidia bacterium]